MTNAFNQIRHACMHGMLAVLTGEVGLGKTLVIRTVLRKLPEEVKVAYLINPLLDQREILREIYTRFTDTPLASWTRRVSPLSVAKSAAGAPKPSSASTRRSPSKVTPPPPSSWPA